VVSLFLARLDYGNSVLAGLPVYLVRRLQSVLNAAARLTYLLQRWPASTGCESMREFSSSHLKYFTYFLRLSRSAHTRRRPIKSPFSSFCRH